MHQQISELPFVAIRSLKQISSDDLFGNESLQDLVGRLFVKPLPHDQVRPKGGPISQHEFFDGGYAGGRATG